jgi:PIN domain nuclease of toxin-antitoxin system
MFFSVVSLWEIMVKNKLGKLPLPLPLNELFAPLKSATGLRILPLKESAIYQLAKIPDLHNDPFDRMLICQALDEDLSIVTPDAKIASYPVATIW